MVWRSLRIVWLLPLNLLIDCHYFCSLGLVPLSLGNHFWLLLSPNIITVLVAQSLQTIILWHIVHAWEDCLLPHRVFIDCLAIRPCQKIASKVRLATRQSLLMPRSTSKTGVAALLLTMLAALSSCHEISCTSCSSAAVDPRQNPLIESFYAGAVLFGFHMFSSFCDCAGCGWVWMVWMVWTLEVYQFWDPKALVFSGYRSCNFSADQGPPEAQLCSITFGILKGASVCKS